MNPYFTWNGLWSRDEEADDCKPVYVLALQEIALQMADARPVAKVVRQTAGRVVVSGWRREEIAECLDLCARVVGRLHTTVNDDERRTADGRFAQIFETPADYKRAWARTNRDAARANSRLQWQKQEAKARADYQECEQIYTSIYPTVRMPGFDGWRRRFWRSWKEDRALCLGSMVAWVRDADKASSWEWKAKRGPGSDLVSRPQGRGLGYGGAAPHAELVELAEAA